MLGAVGPETGAATDSGPCDVMSEAISAHTAGYVPRRPAIKRTVLEFAAFTRRARLDGETLSRLAAGLPRGDGAAVLVLPGVFRGDGQTVELRMLLALLGYAPFGWELGTNYGPTEPLRAGALARLQQIAALHGPVCLVGFSMGGLFARWLALHATDRVRQVITIGSPWRAAMRSAFLPSPLIATAWRSSALATLAGEVETRLAVPATSLFSRRDGIVAWESCRDPAAPDENVEVTCTHVMMEKDPAVFRRVAERLAAGS
jgi:predicted alpha/beta hydrolase family esterase